MPLISIIGVSGSGKSTILQELQKRGFEAHGVDEEGLADWIDRLTGAVVPFPHDDPNQNIHDWYEKHRWVSSIEQTTKLKKLANASGKTIFLAGMAEEEDKVRHLCDKVIYLAVDADTLRQRILNRVDNDFGKTPEEMEIIIGWLRDNDNKYRNSGAIVVDASSSVEEVVENVIRISI
ncbi:MAG TPA: AAA family ATPase [Candidatus Limnocylindrales bacterium]|nr:AAA family ATPase [Candidatus Limnocylindrales bacterium]